MTKDGSHYYLAYDQVGSLRAVVDASGTIVKRIDYDSFGNTLADTNPSFEVPFGFAGGLHDRDTGLVRFGYRDYDPDTGRWTAKDPIGFASGAYIYGYCADSPVAYTDPLGLQRAYPVSQNGITPGRPAWRGTNAAPGSAGLEASRQAGPELLGAAGLGITIGAGLWGGCLSPTSACEQ
jgi:RHS repeat-associated protein